MLGVWPGTHLKTGGLIWGWYLTVFIRNISKQNNEVGSTGIFGILSGLRWKLINLGRYMCNLLEVLQRFGETSTRLHGVTSQTTACFIVTVVKPQISCLVTLLHRSYEVAFAVEVCRYLRREMCDVASSVPCRVHIRRVPPSLINWSSDNISAHSHRASCVYRVSVTSRNVNTNAFTRFSFAPVWQVASLNTTKTRGM
jgi:hypothetical protein